MFENGTCSKRGAVALDRAGGDEGSKQKADGSTAVTIKCAGLHPLRGETADDAPLIRPCALFRPQPIKGPRNTCSGAVEITRKTVTAAPMS